MSNSLKQQHQGSKVSSKTRVDNNGNFVTDDGGRERESTPQEIDKTLREWDSDSGKKSKSK